MMNRRTFGTLALFGLFSHGCASWEHAKDLEHAQTLVAAQAFKPGLVAAPPFVLTHFVRYRASQDWLVMFEGDGRAWLNRRQPSPNPTPDHPIGLELAKRAAQQLPEVNVLYLARPCQYTSPSLNPSCHSRYWTSHRYSPEVVQANVAGLDQILKQYPNPEAIRLHFWGYSGGAALAALVAVQRKDVASFGSVAGNLAPDLLNAWHGVSPLSGSLDVRGTAPRLAKLPQQHWVGAQDTTVPPWVSERWQQDSGSPTNLQRHLLADTDHARGWTGVVFVLP